MNDKIEEANDRANLLRFYNLFCYSLFTEATSALRPPMQACLKCIFPSDHVSNSLWKITYTLLMDSL